MVFINKLFKKEEHPQKQEKHIPEYHKCPLCGEMVKTNLKPQKHYKIYLDGEPKISTKEITDSLQFCKCCGYIYDGYDYEVHKDTPPIVSNETKQIVNSEMYQQTFKDVSIEPVYKKLLLLDLISGRISNTQECCLYHEYKYHFDRGNTEKEQQLLELKLQKALNGESFGVPTFRHTLCYDNKHRTIIYNEDVIIDFLRRCGKFKEAKENIINRIKICEIENRIDGAEHQYLLYQLQLVEAQDKRHI